MVADVTDPERFAEHVVALYRDRAPWAKVRAAGAERVRIECGRETFGAVVEGVLRVVAARPAPVRSLERMTINRKTLLIWGL